MIDIMLIIKILLLYILISLIIMCNAKPEFDSGSFTTLNFCDENIKCPKDQYCILSRCTCKMDSVRYEKNCLPRVKYAEKCVIDEQCADSNQECNNTENNLKICSCKKFHSYSTYDKVCYRYYDIEKDKTYRSHDERRSEEDDWYSTIFTCGIAIMIGSAVLFIFGMLYCCVIYLRNARLTANLWTMAYKLNVPLQIEHTKKDGLNEASIGPIMFDGVIIG